jgi:hypothetical protein
MAREPFNGVCRDCGEKEPPEAYPPQRRTCRPCTTKRTLRWKKANRAHASHVEARRVARMAVRDKIALALFKAYPSEALRLYEQIHELYREHLPPPGSPMTRTPTTRPRLPERCWS